MYEAAVRKKVLCPLTNQKTGKTYWMRIGNAFVNRDGSTNVYLDAYPTNGKLHIRDLDGDESSERRSPPDDANNPVADDECPF